MVCKESFVAFKARDLILMVENRGGEEGFVFNLELEKKTQ